MAHERPLNRIRPTGGWPHRLPPEVWGPTGASAVRPPPRPASDRTPRFTEAAVPGPAPRERFRAILVPLDGTPFGEHALPLALKVARRSAARVRLVHVRSPLAPGHLPDDDPAHRWRGRRRRGYLDDLLRRLARVTAVPVTPVLLERREIVDALRGEADGADLVVMATHGRGPLARLWYGGVADGLLGGLGVPLLLVRGHKAPAELTGSPLLRNVLTALDGSGRDEHVVGPAVALGGLADAEVTLLRVLRPRPDYSLGAGGWPARPAVPSPQAEAWRYLGRLADRLGGRCGRVGTRVVLDELPAAAALLDYARRYDADLIALAADGRGRAARLFGGGLADQVVREATVPVLVVPPGRGQET